ESSVLDYQTKIEWFGTVRGRIGYVWGNGEVPHDQSGGELPIVADLTTAHESARVQCVGASKIVSESAGGRRGSMRVNNRPRNRGVEVGFKSAKAGPHISANVPTGPVIDGRGRGRRNLRESQLAGGKAESGPRKSGYELVAH